LASGTPTKASGPVSALIEAMVNSAAEADTDARVAPAVSSARTVDFSFLSVSLGL
jgi:hypothetical protein